MSKIVNFPGLRFTKPKAEDKPDAEFVRMDDDGVPIYLFFMSYEMEGMCFAEVWAYSYDDALDRVDAMRKSLVLRGQAMGSVPA